ncbi:MAG: hypothetical protein N3E47_07215, partial [Candidatus Bathyarchaeota archaeon]|nr:hypothetical protein [Candidatus Bathyarchaeota archaeon]
PSGAWLRGEWGAAWFGDLQLFASRYAPIRSYVERYVAHLEEKSSLNTVLQELYKWGTQPSFRDWNYLYRLDTLNTIKTGVLAFTLRTSWAYRTRWFTPIEDYQYIRWSNLKPQLKLAFSIIDGFSNEAALNIEENIPTRYYQHFVAAYFLGYITLNVKIVEYNMSKGWYTPVSNVLVRHLSGDPNEYLFWPFNSYSRFSDGDGNVAFYGLIPYRQFTFDAWKFDERDGSITYAVDRGIYGTAAEVAGGISNIAIPVAHPYNLLIPVFKCTEVAFFNVFDVRYLRESYTTFTTIPYRLSVYDSDRKAEPIFHGSYFDPNNGVGLVFVRRGSRIIIAFNPNPAETRRPLILLTNSSLENTEGYGLLVDKPLIIRKTVYEVAKDIYYIALGRYERLKEKNVRNKGAEVLLDNAKIFIEEAEFSLKEKNYRKFFSSSIAALAYTSGAYNGCVMPLIDESGAFLLSFTPIVLIFSVLFERFVFHMYGLKRIIGVFILLVFALAIMGLLTPLFSIVSNSIFMLLGVGILLLSIFIIIIFLRESRELMEYIAETKLGYHIIRTEKTAAMLHSLGVAVDNLRKHFFISVTALITIIVMSAAITTFTSASYTVRAVSTPREGYTPLYEGILIKKLWGIPPDAQRGGVLDVLMMEYLDAIVGENFMISPRVWKYPSSVYAPSIGVLGVKTPIETTNGTRIITPLVLYGVSSIDIERAFSTSLIYFDKYVFDSHKESCLIPESLAKRLNLTVGMSISLKNPEVNLLVVGIFDAIVLGELRDLDGWPILPIDPMYSPTIYRIETPYTETTMPQPIRGDNIIMVRWDKALELGGLVNSIAVIPKDRVEMGRIYEIASRIALGVDATV